jgi:hypothetical protein
VALSFVSRFIRLAYLSPFVLEQIVVHRRPRAVSLDKLAVAAVAPWADHPQMVFEE